MNAKHSSSSSSRVHEPFRSTLVGPILLVTGIVCLFVAIGAFLLRDELEIVLGFLWLSATPIYDRFPILVLAIIMLGVCLLNSINTWIGFGRFTRLKISVGILLLALASAAFGWFYCGVVNEAGLGIDELADFVAQPKIARMGKLFPLYFWHRVRGQKWLLSVLRQLTHEDCWIDSHLETFHGVFVGDAAGPNARLEQRSGGRIVHAACNSHARREFLAAEKHHPQEAAKALAFYKLLYDVETRSQFIDGVDLLEVRRREALPIWTAFDRWMESDALQGVLPKSQLGKALSYMRNHQVALRRYLNDARLPIDNNQSEQTIRPFVIGRRNWTFLGHPLAAPGRLKLFSIASSAHRHGLLVHDYFEDILQKLAYAQQQEPELLQPGSEYLQALLPDHWARANPASVSHERRKEREAVAENKQIRFLRRQLAQVAGRQSQPQASEQAQAS